MRNYIVEFSTCMPVNPRHSDKIGFLSIPLVVDDLSEGKGLVCLNLVGSNPDHGSVVKMKDQLSLLGADLDWSVDLDRRDQLLHHLEKVSGSFQRKPRQMLRCACGRVCMPEGFYNNTKNSATQDGTAKCCGSSLETQSTSVLEMSFDTPSEPLPSVYPEWVTIQLKQEIKKITERGAIIVSKSYDTGLRFQGLSLDNDLFWIFNLQLLRETGVIPSGLVSGVSTIRQVALVYLCEGLTGIKRITFLPRIDFQPVHGVDSLYKAVEKFGAEKVRKVIMRLALSGKQSVTLSGSMFNAK